MIDLHLHLDGSLSPTLLSGLAKRQGLNLTKEEIAKKVVCDSRVNSLNDYLEKFDFTLSLLQTEEAIMEAVFHLVERLNSENMLYAEIRFAPQLHTKKGLSIANVIDVATMALKEANSCFTTKAQLILCCMRGGIENKLDNIKTIEEGRKYLKNGVCAIDLAGAEAVYPTKDFTYLFEICRGIEMPFIVHAGEADGANSVRVAVESGVKRIGHGIALKDDDELLSEVVKAGIGIETCLSSNLQTKAISNISKFPIRKFMDKGALVSVNTDNMTVSNTTVKKEFDLLTNEFMLTPSEKTTLLANAIKTSFLSQQDKAKLMLTVLDGKIK